uniref:XK-related protein n=1 Tax=Toxocara canis TaxID=6265 RepID=A0A183U6J1_TOXCA
LLTPKDFSLIFSSLFTYAFLYFRKFVLYNCLVCFCILFALRLDSTIQLNYAIVFLPLWICESTVFLGAFVAVISYIISPPSSSELALRADFYGLILCTGEHALLSMFEVLACYKLQSAPPLEELPWLLVFAPLFALSLLSIVVAIWAIRHDKSFEFELFFSINVVEFVFLAFKLDTTLDWHWAIVFIPLWVVLSLSVVGVIAYIIFYVYCRCKKIRSVRFRVQVIMRFRELKVTDADGYVRVFTLPKRGTWGKLFTE